VPGEHRALAASHSTQHPGRLAALVAAAAAAFLALLLFVVAGARGLRSRRAA
jgi:hypothetical protein